MSRLGLGRVLAATAALVVGSLVAPFPAFGADSFTPNPFNATVPAGGSTSVAKTLHLDALPGAADIIIAIDTTGSMTAAIAQAKAQATQLCNDVQSAIPGARFAVFDFRDIPDRPATLGVLILTPVFTGSCAAVQAAINTMSAGGGGDCWTPAAIRMPCRSWSCLATPRRTIHPRRPWHRRAATSRRRIQG